jgi:cell filamentation protein
VSKYNVLSGVEDEFEPGSRGSVLRNRLGITDAGMMELAETSSYGDAVAASIEELDTDRTLDVAFIKALHRGWLQDIYTFAGALRTVNLSKGFVVFCPVSNLPEQLALFEREVLRRFTPCSKMETNELAIALAAVHVEFILIHPFRDGNGRVGRWIAMLMALQAGRPLLDFSEEATAGGRERYFGAMRKGFAGSMRQAEQLFTEIIKRSS